MHTLTRFEFANNRLLVPLVIVLVASGCSLEKRTLMSGFHVEHRSKASHRTPAQHQPQQVTSVVESTSNVYASSEAIEPEFSEPETNVYNPIRMHDDATALYSSAHSPAPAHKVMAVAIADTTSSAGKSFEASPEFTQRELNRWRGRAILRALMSLTAAAIAIISAAIDGFALSYFLGIIFMLSAIKWIILAGRPGRLRMWRDERARARQDRTFKSILIRVLKWLLAIPISIALLLGLLFSLAGGL